MLKTKVIVGVVFLGLAYGLAWSQTKTSGTSNVVATINGEKITATDLQNKAKELQLDKALGQLDAGLENKILQDLINEKLVEQKARKMNLKTDKQFQNQLKEHLTSFALRKMYQDLVTNHVSVTDLDIVAYYEENKEKMFKQSEEIRASHILINVEEDTGIKNEKKRAQKADQEARKRVKELQKRIKKGEDFVELAKRFSKDNATREKEGDLGYFPRGKMVAEFDEAAWNLEIGEISQPVKTAFGYHFILLVDKRPEGHQPLDEKLSEAIQSRLKRENEQKRSNAFMDSLQGAAAYLFNEKVLSQPETLVAGNPWVLIVNKKDTIKFQDFKKELPGYLFQRKLAVATLDDKKEFLKVWSRNLVLKQAALKLGYLVAKETKEEAAKYTTNEAKRRVMERKGDANYQPTEVEMRKYYDTHPEKYAAANPLHIQHIIFSDSLQAAGVRKKILAGADFKEMALQYYPGDEEIREVAYDLGYISGEEFPPGFFKAAWKLKNGEVSHPLKTSWGYHLIKLIDKKEKLSFEQASPEIRKALIEQKNDQVQKQWERNLRQGANIWINQKLLKTLALEPKAQTAEEKNKAGSGE
ncbi:MAG TPA: peptidylprolyl isomerase [candidate division Zixibacteria bacterium]|nr:peptidylprolyl isomerase [candidate division Zixibacteria bacterium]